MVQTQSHVPRVAIVIPTYNRAELLRLTLQSLADQPLDRDTFEVIVSDDGSSDATRDVVTSFEDRLRLRYTFQEDLGFRAALARNAGARLAAAPVLIFLDSGTLAGPDFVDAHLAAHATEQRRVVLGYTYAHQPLMRIRGLADAVASMTPVEVVAQFEHKLKFRDSRHQELQKVDFDLGRLHLPWNYLYSMNFSVHTDDFWAVGGFDENFRSWGTEDTDLGYRLFHHGLAVRMDRTAWALEAPHPRDIQHMFTSGRATMRQFLDKTADPAIELTFELLMVPWSLEPEYATLIRWREEAKDISARAEIARALADAQPGQRICVIGCGGDIPDHAAAMVLVDFDEDRLSKVSGYADQTVHALGLHLPFPDRSMDIVLITSRLRGVWERWGEALTAEATRVGHVVQVSPMAE